MNRYDFIQSEYDSEILQAKDGKYVLFSDVEELLKDGSFEETMKYWQERCVKAESRIGDIYNIVSPSKKNKT